MCAPPACKSHLAKPSTCVKQEIPTKAPNNPPKVAQPSRPPPKGVSPQEAKPTAVPVKCVKSEDRQSAAATAEAQQTTAEAAVATGNGTEGAALPAKVDASTLALVPTKVPPPF